MIGSIPCNENFDPFVYFLHLVFFQLVWIEKQFLEKGMIELEHEIA
jgi:hypothetical protein